MTKLAVTIAEATEMSGIGRTKLYEEMRSGRLKARKSGRRTLILVEDLEAYTRSLPAAEMTEAA